MSVECIVKKIKPYLKHGGLLLVSNFKGKLALISPTPIKHTGFLYLENNTWFVIEMTETSELKKVSLEIFLQKRQSIFLFDFYDIKIMKTTMNYIFDYKDFSYGMFGDQQYCYKIIYTLYNKAMGNVYKKMSDFFPVFKIFGLEFSNSNSILRSKKFIPQCAVINQVLVRFKQGL